MEELKKRALAIARTQIGVCETGRNCGPEVDAYLHAVGLPPGHPWCAAFVVWAYLQAARELQIRKFPLKRTGKVIRLWEAGAGRFGRKTPTVGDIYCHAKDPLNADSAGHCGIVSAVRADGSFSGIEGNTSEDGSREGRVVWENHRGPQYANLGFLDVAHEVTLRIRRPRLV